MNYIVFQFLEIVTMVVSIAYAWACRCCHNWGWVHTSIPTPAIPTQASPNQNCLNPNITGRTEITHPKIQPVYIKSGDTLELICEHDGPFSLQWYRDTLFENTRQYTKIDTSSESAFYMTSLVEGGRGWTNLTKSNVSEADAGSYKCSLVTKPDRAFAVDVIVVTAKEIPAVVARNSSSITIGCTVANRDRLRFGISWWKDGHVIVNDSTHYSISRADIDFNIVSMLNITKVGDRDIGAYHCLISLTYINLTQIVNVMALPQVRAMSRSRNLVAGSTLELECRVSGWPLPRVTWQKLGSGAEGRVPLDFSDERLSVRPGVAVAPLGVAVENATLVITNVTYADRDVYVCDMVGYFEGTWRHDNSTVLVRIKGKYAIIWPLLGILMEAVVLFVIIIVHERNRSRKKKAENEDTKDMSANHLENSSTAQRGGSTAHETMRLRKN